MPWKATRMPPPAVVTLAAAEFRHGVSPTNQYFGARDTNLSEDDPGDNFGSTDPLVASTEGSANPVGSRLYVANSASTGGGDGFVSVFELPSAVDNPLPADNRLGNDREVIVGLDGNLLVGNLKTQEVLSVLVRHGTVTRWYLIAKRVFQHQITIY